MTKSRYDRWSTEGMPSGAERERILHDIANTMRGALQDARNGISKSASMAPPAKDETPPAAGSGSTDLKPVAGIPAMDRIAEHFAEQDRLASIRQQMQNAEIEKRFASRGSDPYKAKTEYDILKKYDDSVPGFHREKKE